MADRATYLARTILSRIRALDEVLPVGSETLDPEAETRRADVIRKLLAVETGTTFGPTIQILTQSLPRMSREREISDRELQEYAALIQRELGTL